MAKARRTTKKRTKTKAKKGVAAKKTCCFSAAQKRTIQSKLKSLAKHMADARHDYNHLIEALNKI